MFIVLLFFSRRESWAGQILESQPNTSTITNTKNSGASRPRLHSTPSPHVSPNHLRTWNLPWRKQLQQPGAAAEPDTSPQTAPALWAGSRTRAAREKMIIGSSPRLLHLHTVAARLRKTTRCPPVTPLPQMTHLSWTQLTLLPHAGATTCRARVKLPGGLDYISVDLV